MIILDTSVAYALLAEDDARHREAADWYSQSKESFATTPLVLAEIDHLVLRRGGRAAVGAFRRDVVSGAYGIEWWPQAAAEAVEVAEQYADLGLSLTDASLVALAARTGTTSVATFDERHFRAVRPLSGGPAFTLLPTDTELA